MFDYLPRVPSIELLVAFIIHILKYTVNEQQCTFSILFKIVQSSLNF
nr:MAG TPA: hypothetical protein [Bacteriophage sp.]